MTKLIVDANLPGKLSSVFEPVELCDANGRILGRFIPRLDPAMFILEPQISPQELQRRRQANERTYTTAEVLAYLEKL